MRYLICSFVFILSCAERSAPLTAKAEMSIVNASFNGKVVVEPLSAIKGFRVSLYKDHVFTDRAIFKYQSYKLDTADVNRDGHTDILIGLIKSTEFDPVVKRRLFILRIDEGQLRPLWLGTRVCQELQDFKALSNGVIQTLEKTKNGNYAIGQYRWQSFGLALITYIQNEIPFEDASALFNQ